MCLKQDNVSIDWRGLRKSALHKTISDRVSRDTPDQSGRQKVAILGSRPGLGPLRPLPLPLTGTICSLNVVKVSVSENLSSANQMMILAFFIDVNYYCYTVVVADSERVEQQNLKRDSYFCYTLVPRSYLTLPPNQL